MWTLRDVPIALGEPMESGVTDGTCSDRGAVWQSSSASAVGVMHEGTAALTDLTAYRPQDTYRAL